MAKMIVETVHRYPLMENLYANMWMALFPGGLMMAMTKAAADTKAQADDDTSNE